MASKGGKWKGHLTFYNADNGTEKVFNSNSLHNLKDYLGRDYQLATVRLAKDPLVPFQLTSFWLYHLYVILRTDDQQWWFTLEKVGEGLVLQKSRNLEDVKFYRQGVKRTWINSRVTVSSCDYTSKRLFDVIDWLLRDGSLTHQYHFLDQNCKHFAKDAYNEIALSDVATMFHGMGIIFRVPLFDDLLSKDFENTGY